ncbi:DUF2845 domain-containing protein [Entomomonas sp. E2T0]|uniref:DUF2845 domain-containing protein n=1 Tax=Entomomonas sp. E2T0 TaxID=2930213 RepID=UPI0022285218|nr:DUF2845 domain-containing protein [Entomomonas sp. E2T0]UYZ84113.1 DUF2845 domain-containing protein [Entomomonas sp. E2T0]
MRQLISLIIFVSVFSPSLFAASTWRCGGGLVSTGNTKIEVINRCSEPNSKSFLGWGRRVTRGWGNYFEDVPIEEWIYSVSDSLYYVLKFEGDELKDITSHYSY